MKNLSIIIAITALLIFGFGCANLASVLTGSSPFGVSAFSAGDSFPPKGGRTLGSESRQYVGPDYDSRSRDLTAASICRGSGIPTHICGESNRYY